MSTAAINKFILFRNYATMGSTGFSDFPSDPTLPRSLQVRRWLSSITTWGIHKSGTSQDFGQVNTVSTGSGSSLRTDQSFINRAELINFLKSTGIANVNTLQYLGTFSRERNHSTVSNSVG